MVNTQNPPVMSMINSAEKIYKMRKSYELILIWAITASIWLITSVLIIIIGVIFFKPYEAFLIDILAIIAIAVGFPSFIISIPVIYLSWKSNKKLHSFTSKFYPLWVKIRVEIEQPDGKDIIEKSINELESIDNRFKNCDINPELPKKLSYDKLPFNRIVKGKRILAEISIINDNNMDINNLYANIKKISKGFKIKNNIILIITCNEPDKYLKEPEKKLKNTDAIYLNYYNSKFSVIWVL